APGDGGGEAAAVGALDGARDCGGLLGVVGRCRGGGYGRVRGPGGVGDGGRDAGVGGRVDEREAAAADRGRVERLVEVGGHDGVGSGRAACRGRGRRCEGGRGGGGGESSVDGCAERAAVGARDGAL